MPNIPFDQSLKHMAGQDPQFATQLLEDAVNAMLAGNPDEGRVLLKNHVLATIGFPELARRTGKDEKNLMRSLRANSNPTTASLFEIIQACVEAEGVTLTAHAVARTEQRAFAPGQ